MILKNNNEVRKIYFGSAPAPSLNYNNSRAFRYVVDEYVPPVYTCPDVVQTMDGYEGDAKEVYAKDTEKWYMQNNIGNYEEYGILEEVQSLDSATFYEGKLVICDNHEYESVGGNWVDLGAGSGATKIIQSPSTILRSSSSPWKIPLGYTASTDTRFTMGIKSLNNGGAAIIGSSGSSDSNDNRVLMSSSKFIYDVVDGRLIANKQMLNTWVNIEFGNYYIKDLTTGTNIASGTKKTYQRGDTMTLGFGGSDTFDLSALTMYHGDTLERDFIPAIDGNDICLYDKVSDAYFKSDNGKMPLSGGTITEVEVGTKTYPKDYETKDAPEDNVTVESLDLIECPYEGMTAYVNGVKYTYENGEWIEHEMDWSKKYLTFETIDDTVFTFTPSSSNTVDNTSETVYYSIDGGANWSDLGASSPVVPSGERIMFKASLTPAVNNGVGTFSSTGKFKAMGNPLSMLLSDSFVGVTELTGRDYALASLFKGCAGIVDAQNLSLDSDTLSNYCYYYMFAACAALTTPPALPATTLTNSCYYNMFSGCTSLATAPELPATTLASYCYNSMFKECSSLTTAPELPATLLAERCYEYMFVNCTSLVNVQEVLPAKRMVYYGYSNMFYGCTSLTTAPELPATTLAEYCYKAMFSGCTSLTEAPELPALTLIDNCYGRMFENCSSLNYIKAMYTKDESSGASVSGSKYSWVNGVSSSGTFVKNKNAKWTNSYGVNEIPQGWTVVLSD